MDSPKAGRSPRLVAARIWVVVVQLHLFHPAQQQVWVAWSRSVLWPHPSFTLGHEPGPPLRSLVLRETRLGGLGRSCIVLPARPHTGVPAFGARGGVVTGECRSLYACSSPVPAAELVVSMEKTCLTAMWLKKMSNYSINSDNSMPSQRERFFRFASVEKERGIPGVTSCLGLMSFRRLWFCTGPGLQKWMKSNWLSVKSQKWGFMWVNQNN